jgi:hypothetical protein
MKLGELLDQLKEYDKESTVFVGELSNLSGGLGAIIKADNLYVSKVSNSVIIHTNDPKKDSHQKDNFRVLTSFD